MIYYGAKIIFAPYKMFLCRKKRFAPPYLAQKCNAQINKLVNLKGLYEWLGRLRSGYLIKNSKTTNFFKWIEQIAALGITCGRKMSVHWGCVKLNIFVNFSEVEGVIYF
ncbi:hypothetical protein ACFL0B_00670 [Thermodesulfobacteriota bacterium]